MSESIQIHFIDMPYFTLLKQYLIN